MTSFEDLPDELLLFICGYLSSTDVLWAFHGLNSRLTRAIDGYTRHVVLGQTSYTQFQQMCTSVLPRIGSRVTSLVVSNQWTGVLSRIFLSYFGESMALAFPRLKQLTLISFNVAASKAFFAALRNLCELNEVHLHFQYDATNVLWECQSLLQGMFTANDHRLSTILFDNDSIIFSLNAFRTDVPYSHVRRLSIDIETIDDLHQLLTLLPQLEDLHVTTNEEVSSREESTPSSPNVALKRFQLRSFGPSWHLVDLTRLIKRIPNVEDLTIAVDSVDDPDLLDGERIFAQLQDLSLKKFNYFLQFYDPSSSMDSEQILSSWHRFDQRLLCYQNEQKRILALFTLPFDFRYILMECSVIKHELFVNHCASQTTNMILHGVPSNITHIFPILNATEQLQTLSLRIDNSVSPDTSEPVPLRKLPFLTKLVVWPNAEGSIDCFQRLLEVSPNLYHLEAKYELISVLVTCQHLWPVFGRRFTHLYVAIPSTVTLESAVSTLEQLPSIFPSLKRLYIKLEKNFPPTETIVLTVLKHLVDWKRLVSLGVVDVILNEFADTDLRRWVKENANQSDDRIFYADYVDRTFRLWF